MFHYHSLNLLGQKISAEIKGCSSTATRLDAMWGGRVSDGHFGVHKPRNDSITALLAFLDEMSGLGPMQEIWVGEPAQTLED